MTSVSPVDFSVRTNLPDFRAELKRLEARFRTRAVNNALRAAGRVFAKDAKRRAPVRRRTSARLGRPPGLLRDSIGVRKSSRYRSRQSINLWVGVRARRKRGHRGKVTQPFYWYFLEGGWYPHTGPRRVSKGKRSTALRRQRKIAAGAQKVRHPFLAPAFASNKGQALGEFNKSLSRWIARYEAQQAK